MTTEKLYVEGRRFRVVKEGARFEGLLLYGEQSMSGWSRKILPGEILTCLGWQEVQVFGTHVAGIMWTGQKVPDNAMVMQVWPFESLFRPFPMRGVLEPYVEPPADELEVMVDHMITPWPEEIDDGETVDLTEHYGPVTAAPDEDEEEIVDLRGF
jgi:hypothetical protein